MALSPDLFKRLSKLNRERLQEQLSTADRAESLREGPVPHAAPSDTVHLEDLIPGEERQTSRGRFYLVRRRAEDLCRRRPDEADHAEANVLSRYRHVLLGAGRAVGPDDLNEGLRPLVLADAARITYLDIETCGLAGEPLFLVGMMRYADETLLIEQFLARDYSEEGPLLAAAWQALGRAACLVTFNGKTFDMPTVMARSLACGLFDAPEVPDHVDLLFEARRRWRRVLPNCRLQTLEQLICGRRRAGDIPGADIPAAYHEFVRSGLADDPVRRRRSLRQLQTILHHNALDLLTMADLVVHFLSAKD